MIQQGTAYVPFHRIWRESERNGTQAVPYHKKAVIPNEAQPSRGMT